MDLRLTQKEVAEKLRVDKTTVQFWENNRVKPSLAKIPKIIEFLGRDPFEKVMENLGDKIREYRRIHGLTQKKLAGLLGIDQITLAGWERETHRPSRRLLEKVLLLLSSYS